MKGFAILMIVTVGLVLHQTTEAQACSTSSSPTSTADSDVPVTSDFTKGYWMQILSGGTNIHGEKALFWQ